MLSQYVTLLQTAINAANAWRTASTAVNVELLQINFVFPDGKAVILSWDISNNEWQVDTQ